MITQRRQLLKQLLDDMENAAQALEHSLGRCQDIALHDGLSLNDLEKFEALTSRFSRLSDLMLQKVFRSVDQLDLDDEGTNRDRINRAAKKGMIKNARTFIEIRLLRNEISHDYKAEAIHSLFEQVLHLTPELLEDVDLTHAYASKYLSAT